MASAFYRHTLCLHADNPVWMYQLVFCSWGGIRPHQGCLDSQFTPAMLNTDATQLSSCVNITSVNWALF